MFKSWAFKKQEGRTQSNRGLLPSQHFTGPDPRVCFIPLPKGGIGSLHSNTPTATTACHHHHQHQWCHHCHQTQYHNHYSHLSTSTIAFTTTSSLPTLPPSPLLPPPRPPPPSSSLSALMRLFLEARSGVDSFLWIISVNSHKTLSQLLLLASFYTQGNSNFEMLGYSNKVKYLICSLSCVTRPFCLPPSASLSFPKCPSLICWLYLILND